MTAADRLDEQHTLIAPAVRYVIEQNDILPDPAFDALAGVTRRWETALRAVLALHSPIDALMNPGRRERMVKVCTGCGTDDGNWQHYPCPTVRAITTALDGAS